MRDVHVFFQSHCGDGQSGFQDSTAFLRPVLMSLLRSVCVCVNNQYDQSPPPQHVHTLQIDIHLSFLETLGWITLGYQSIVYNLYAYKQTLN